MVVVVMLLLFLLPLLLLLLLLSAPLGPPSHSKRMWAAARPALGPKLWPPNSAKDPKLEGSHLGLVAIG